ncbi:MAG TPA: hypothetical protein VNI01_05965, partial [Elusimicrobiota bacterium]|nr:hypothetical protein [Elusimicrobiota bacterium]
RRHLAQLRDYARRGRFPTNTARPDALVPCIRDASGTLCAVAHMLDASGEGALVDVLAREDNHVVVSALREGPLLRWLARAGITQEEAARIQALYVPPEPSLIIPQALEGIPTDSLELRVAALAAGLLAWLAWRLYRARRASAAAGPLPSPAAPRKEPVAL